jgi:hypothetical protein
MKLLFGAPGFFLLAGAIYKEGSRRCADLDQPNLPW